MTPLILLLAAAAQAPAATAPRAPLAQQMSMKGCTDLVRTAPLRALDAAETWRREGGGLDSHQCSALALAALERWPAAAAAFELTALEAERVRDTRSADYWVQAGNAWLAAADFAKARKDFDTALATSLLSPALRGEVRLDRARAAVAAGDPAAARADVDEALKLVARDPFAWYLSAALARRENNLPRAKADIATALGLGPDDPALLLEAGTIAGVAGDTEGARAFYRRAAQAGPATEPGRAAALALADDPPAAAPAAAATPK